MAKLFDLAIPGPARPRPRRERRRREEELRVAPTAQAIWSCLFDHGADPLVLASLLRDKVSANERSRAYYELVHQVGAALAEQAWDEAFCVRDQLSRRAFPVGVQEIAEAALGQPLVGIHVVTGELVDLVAARMGTPAFNIGSEVFVRSDALTGESRAILVHEAVHATQQRGAVTGDRPAPPSGAAEKDAHRVLGRLGPLGASERILKERARAQTVVRAALGRAPRLSRQPLQVAAYEPTPQIDTIVKDARRLADAVVALLERNAAVDELKAALGPVAEDDAATRTLKVTLQLLADRRLASGANARGSLADKLGALTLSALGFSPGKKVPSEVKGALESRLSRSLDHVQLHDDADAAAKTRAVDAVALTQGRHVYFAPGKLNPGSTEGRRLLAHELAHVAQQAGTPATSAPAVSAPGSPVEREAERVGEAFARGEPAGAADFAIREQAPSGTLSRDDGKQRPSGYWGVKMLGQTLPLDLATAVDAPVAGRKRLQLGQTRLGPIRIQEVDVELDGSTVKRGFLNARIDDGRFQGSTASLIVDASGHVSGSLDVDIRVPGALAKKVTLHIGEGPLQLSVQLANGDFLSRELPVTASAMGLVVKQSADALDISLDGSARVGLDKGFADASGTLTARLGVGSSGVTLDATIQGNLKVPGLGETAATLQWDGKQTTLRLQSAVQVRGLSGTAQLTYQGGKLSAQIRDLKFDAAALQPLRLGPASIENGKLKAHVEVADGTTLGVPGVRAVLGGATKLDLDGDRIAGRAVGKLELGPSAALFSGSFDFAFADGSLDGQVRLDSSVPFFAGGVTVTVKGLGTKNDITIGGDVTVNIGGGKVIGKWSHLAFSNGSLTGDISLKVALPQLTLPQLDLQVLPGWKIHAKLPELTGRLDLGGALGTLEALGVHVAVGDTDVSNLPGALGDITLKAATVRVPLLEPLGSIENLDVTIPGKGGHYDFGQATGSASLKITRFRDPVVVRFALANGKLSATGGGAIDVAKLTSDLLSGAVTVKFSDDRLDFEANNIRVKNESVSKIISIDRFEYKNGELDAKITANHGFKFILGGKPASVTGGSVAYNHGKLSGEVTCEAEMGHSKVAGKIGFKDGHLELEVGGEFDVAQFTGGRLKGRVKASTAGSVERLEEIRFAGELEKLSKVKITKLSGDLKKGQFAIGVRLDDAMKDLAASWKLLELKLKSADAQLGYRDGAISIAGHVGGDAWINLGGKTVMSGAFELGYKNGFSAKVKLAKVDLENKYFKIRKGDLDTDAGRAAIELDVNIPGVLKPGARITGAIDVQAGTFDVQGDFHLAIGALKDLQLHAGINEKGVDIRAKLDGKNTFKLGPAELTLDADSNLAYDGAKLAGSLSGTAKLGHLATGKFDFHVQGSAITGHLHVELNNLPMLKPGTVIDADFKDNQLNTAPIKLELDPMIAKFIDGEVHLQIVGNQIEAGGRIKEIKGLGKLGKSVRDSHVRIDKDSGDIDITGTIDVAGVAGLKPGSQLTLGVVKGSFYISGDLKLQSKGSLTMEGGFQFEWKDGIAKLKGGCEADLGGLAHLSIKVTNNPKEEGSDEVVLPEGSTDFKLSGKLTLEGLQSKFKSLRFSKAPEVCFWATAGNGELDYGMDDFSTEIVQLPGVDSCKIAVTGKYNKTNGFDAHVDLGTVKIKMFRLGGGIDIQQSKFAGTTINIESDVSAINLAGQITIHPGDLDKFNAEARLDVKGDSASGRKWLDSGNAHVGFKEGKLDSAGGKITLKKPPLLPLEKLTFEIEKRGEKLHGELATEFEIPFGADHKKGHLKATFGGDEGWSVAIDADIKPPGFKEGHLGGTVDGDGKWDVHGDLHADGNKFIQAASLRMGYEEARGFYLGGSVTLRINDKLSGEIHVEYNAKKQDFDFKGTVKRKHTPEPKVVKPLAGWRFGNSIPLGGVGFVEIFLNFFAGFSFNLEMPQVEFDELQVKGSLKSLLDGKLPEIRVKGSLGMGVSAAFELGVGIGGRIELLIAEAEAGLTGTFKASAGLQVGAKVDGVLGGDHDGLDVDVDPVVTPHVELTAKLEAYFYARAFCFTIIDKTWKLGEVKLGAFDLPKWAPFHKFTINVGGSGPVFKNGEPKAKTEKPPGLEDGSKKSGEDSSEQAKDAETKKNVRPVMEAIKTAGRKLEELPAPEKMTEPPSIEDVWLVPYDARRLYANWREEAEQWFPELTAVTPGEKMAKSIAVAGFFELLKAKGALMGWRRAQIAHQGIDPDTGFNVAALRAQVQDAEDKKYAAELAAATAAKKAQDDEWAAAMQKQAEELAKAEKEHEEKFEKTKREHVEAVKQLEVEARIAQQKLEEAAKEARKEGVKEQPTAEEKAPPPPAPPAPEPPPPLRKPEPIAKRPPIPLPVAPPPLPPVIVPPLPTCIDDARDFGTDAPEVPDMAPPTPPAPDPKPSAPPSSEGATEGSKAVSVGSGGGGSVSKGGSGDLRTGGSKSSGSGGGSASATVEGDASLGAQARSLVEKRLHMNEAGAAKPSGERSTSGAPGVSAPAAASVDPTVQRVVDAGKTQEETQEKETRQKDEEFEQKIQEQKQVKGKGEAKLKEAVAKKHAENQNKKQHEKEEPAPHKMPADGDFPVGEADKVRVAFSNWLRLGRSGETLDRFAERMATRHYFDFEEKVWRSVVGEFKKIFDAARPEDATPDPREFAERLYTGNSWLGKDYKPSASFDASFSLSDESIRARETLDKFKALYRGNRAGDYLGAEAEKLDEAQKTSFINTKLATVVGAGEPMKVLRLAIERLGPAAEVSKKLAEIDDGKSVDASDLWMQLGWRFSPSTPGMQQITAAIQAVEAMRASPEGPTPHDPARDKKDDSPSMMRWVEAESAFAALDRDAALEALLADLGCGADRDLAVNQAALLERRRQDIQSITESMKSKRPEEIFRAWVEKNHKKTVEVNRAVAQIATAYAEKIGELRRAAPRLDADGVTRAAALFRRRIGSNTLIWALGELNPPDCKLEEKVDAAVAIAPVDGATWNALLDPAWVSNVYEKFDATLFVRNERAASPPRSESKRPVAEKPEGQRQEARPDGKPSEKDPADVTDEKSASHEPTSHEPARLGLPGETPPGEARPGETPPGERAEAAAHNRPSSDPAAAEAGKNPEELERAEAKLRTALRLCGAQWPARLQSMGPREKLALAGKPERDLRRELFADFESLQPSMGPRAIEICRQLTEENGLAEGYERLPQAFAREAYESFIKGDAAADFEDLFAKVAKSGKGNGDGYLMKGRPFEKQELDAIAPDDKSLTCVLDTAALDEEVLRLSVVKADFEKEWPSAEGKPEELVAFALGKIKKDPVAHVARYCNGPELVRLPSWSFPRPEIKSDPVFAETCDLGAVYASWASWDPKGHLRMTLKREAVMKKLAEKQLRRPTVFDGMLSPRWLKRDRRDRDWGAAGGGLNEALMKVDWEDVDHSKWVCVEADAKNEAVLQRMRRR